MNNLKRSNSTRSNSGYESNESNESTKLKIPTISPKLTKIETKLPKANLPKASKQKVLNKNITQKMHKNNANNNYSYIVSDDLKIIVQPIIAKNSSKTIDDIIIENIKKEQEIIKSKAITRKYVHDYSKPFINID